MTAWTASELDKIGQEDELAIQTTLPDGTLRHPVIVWVVRVGDELFVRAVRGTSGLWYRHTQDQPRGRVSSAGITKDITFEPANSSLSDDIDQAYRTKYARYADNYVKPTLTPEAQAATLRLVPR